MYLNLYICERFQQFKHAGEILYSVYTGNLFYIFGSVFNLLLSALEVSRVTQLTFSIYCERFQPFVKSAGGVWDNPVQFLPR